MKKIPASWLATLVLAALALIGPRPALAGHEDYIALGDSLAFGEYRFLANPSNGDRGYVGPFADYLAFGNGGVRPTVINLGVDGETSTTFLNGGPPGDGFPGMPGYALNTNYSAPFPSQNALLLSTIAAEHAAGNTINTVTIQLGANDLFSLTLDPAFFAKTQAQQQALVFAALQSVQATDTTLLTELKMKAPEAKIILLGYYDPFAPFAGDQKSPFFPVAQASGPAIQGLNQVIAGEAAAFGARYVDLFTPFVGHELTYTDVTNPDRPGNIHPSPAGYNVIVQQLVPEPGSLVLMGLGTGVLLGSGRFRRPKAR